MVLMSKEGKAMSCDTEKNTVVDVCTGCCESCRNNKVKSLPVKLEKEVQK